MLNNIPSRKINDTFNEMFSKSINLANQKKKIGKSFFLPLFWLNYDIKFLEIVMKRVLLSVSKKKNKT